MAYLGDDSGDGPQPMQRAASLLPRSRPPAQLFQARRTGQGRNYPLGCFGRDAPDGEGGIGAHRSRCHWARWPAVRGEERRGAAGCQRVSGEGRGGVQAQYRAEARAAPVAAATLVAETPSAIGRAA